MRRVMCVVLVLLLFVCSSLPVAAYVPEEGVTEEELRIWALTWQIFADGSLTWAEARAQAEAVVEGVEGLAEGVVGWIESLSGAQSADLLSLGSAGEFVGDDVTGLSSVLNEGDCPVNETGGRLVLTADWVGSEELLIGSFELSDLSFCSGTNEYCYWKLFGYGFEGGDSGATAVVVRNPSGVIVSQDAFYHDDTDGDYLSGLFGYQGAWRPDYSAGVYNVYVRESNSLDRVPAGFSVSTAFRFCGSISCDTPKGYGEIYSACVSWFGAGYGDLTGTEGAWVPQIGARSYTTPGDEVTYVTCAADPASCGLELNVTACRSGGCSATASTYYDPMTGVVNIEIEVTPPEGWAESGESSSWSLLGSILSSIWSAISSFASSVASGLGRLLTSLLALPVKIAEAFWTTAAENLATWLVPTRTVSERVIEVRTAIDSNDTILSLSDELDAVEAIYTSSTDTAFAVVMPDPFFGSSGWTFDLTVPDSLRSIMQLITGASCYLYLVQYLVRRVRAFLGF